MCLPSPAAAAATRWAAAPQKLLKLSQNGYAFDPFDPFDPFAIHLRNITMFENLCALPVEHDIFVQTVHPEQPLVAVGLANGDVHTYRLPSGASDEDDDDTTLASENGFGTIDRIWRTRRHKGSCRTLAYSVDGASLISAGTDGIVKVADSMTGQVTAKIAIPLDP
jgi:WD40 repeat protein